MGFELADAADMMDARKETVCEEIVLVLHRHLTLSIDDSEVSTTKNLTGSRDFSLPTCVLTS